MTELKNLYQPQSLDQALALLQEHGARARILAGGTTLALSPAGGVDTLIDLRRAGLDAISEQADGLHLGAMVSCRQLRRFFAGRPANVLAEAAGVVGSRVLQNHVTVGGNCVMVYAWSDLPVALLCVGARFVIQGQARRELSAEAFFAQHPARLLQPGELVTEVVVPPPPAGSGSAYCKLSRDATDQALATVAAQVSLAAGKVQAARVVVGAVRALPQLVPQAAAALAGEAPTPEALAEAGRLAAGSVKIVEDFKASAEYRAQLVRTLTADALAVASERAGGAR